MRNPLDHVDELCAWLAATDIGLLELIGPTGTLRLLHDGASVEIQDVDETDAAQRGTVTDVLVERGKVVGFGTPLFELQPIGSNES